MGDYAGETVPCHYCGAEVEVPSDRSRFEAFTAHFEAEHIRDRIAVPRERESLPGSGVDPEPESVPDADADG